MAAVLAAHGVSKQFRRTRRDASILKAALLDWVTGNRRPREAHWALRDVTFAVERGRAVGIVGHNGAGKSTLLRLCCGVGRPTAGHIDRVAPLHALLELGSGFHPDLTGGENLMTAGILSGFTARDVRARQQEIVAFAELEEFIDEPVRTYSAGMFLRLAFAAAMHFDPAVLVVDEVLAVGDARFQQRCLERLEAFRAKGGTLLFASHVIEHVRALCDEVLVLEEGRVVMQGDPDEALACYDELLRARTERRVATLGGARPSGPAPGRGIRTGTQEATIGAVRLRDPAGELADHLPSGGALTVELDYVLGPAIADVALSLGIFSDAVKCFEVILPSAAAVFGALPERGRLCCRLPDLRLLRGRYFVNVGLYPPGWGYIYDHHWQMHPVDVTGDSSGARGEVSGVLACDPVWSVDRVG
jgi:lipopolysaccharide transport system ATP-binding protein